jgi:serine/threonine protein kinase
VSTRPVIPPDSTPASPPNARPAFDANHLPALAKLFDEALQTPTVERAAWLDRLRLRDPAQHAELQRLLQGHREAEAEDFLNRTLTVELAAHGHDAPGLKQLGAYRLLKKLGDGGMSTVWLAERADGQFEGQVAIKLLPPSLAGHAGFRERLHREAQILAGLSHKNIAKLLDAGIADDGTPYLVLELVQGQSVTAWCDARHASVRDRVALMLQVCDAVAYLHGNLVIHRDIKPSNVMVDQTGSVKLVDFGIAKLLDESRSGAELTEQHGGAFTPDYAAPEQIQGRPLTTAADVYSLGALLYRLLSGFAPYAQASGAAQVAAAMATGSPTRPSRLFAKFSTLPPGQLTQIAQARGCSVVRLERQIRDELDVVVLEALAAEPEQRYASVSALAGDLRAYLHGLPIQARKPTWGYAISKFAKRHAIGVTLSVLSLAFIVGLGGLSLWQGQRARIEAARTEKVLGFITELLRKSDPNQTDGKRITVAELLKGTLPEVQKRFGDDPVAHRKVVATIVGILEAMEENEEAIGLLRAQRVHSQRYFGAASMEAAKDDVNLGVALFSHGGHEEAIEVLQSAIAKMDALGQMDTESYLSAHVGVARSAVTLQRFDLARQAAAKSETVFARVRTLLTDDERAWFGIELQRIYGFDVKETARWLEFRAREKLGVAPGGAIQQTIGGCGDAWALFSVGKSQEALIKMRSTVAELRRLTGEGSLIDEACSNDLGLIEMELMHVDEAKRTQQRLIDLAPTSKLPTRSVFIAQDLARQGQLALRSLDIAQAARYQQQAREAIAQKGAFEAPTLLWLEAQLALVQGQWPQARIALNSLREKAVARHAPGAKFEGVVRVDVSIASLTLLEGRAQDAALALKQALADMKSILPYEDARVARIEAYLAQALLVLGQYDGAARHASDASTKAVQWLAADHPLAAQAQYIHAQALQGLGRLDEAGGLMRQAQATFTARFGKPLDEMLMRVLY